MQRSALVRTDWIIVSQQFLYPLSQFCGAYIKLSGIVLADNGRQGRCHAALHIVPRSNATSLNVRLCKAQNS